MGCADCLLTEKERQDLIIKVEQEAKKNAVELKKFMVLYDLPGGKVSYMEAEAARNAGITPIKFVSHL
jgi:hypothetical protein